MPLTNVTRRSVIDVARVLDAPPKLVIVKGLKMNNYKIMSTATKN